MKILIACEFSGIVRSAFEKKGHDAWSCDLLLADDNGQHIQGDVLQHLNKGWDLMIAHPPCTYLSNAGARFLYPTSGVLNKERYKKGLEAKDFFLKLLNANIEKIAVENPISSRIFKMPNFTQEIQPYEFGHPYSKKTRLWLKGLSKLKSTNIIDKKYIKTFIPSNCSGFKHTNKNKGRSFPKNDKERSKFWTGIAEAMADQWG